jgi:hypothetical protein
MIKIDLVAVRGVDKIEQFTGGTPDIIALELAGGLVFLRDQAFVRQG